MVFLRMFVYVQGVLRGTEEGPEEQITVTAMK